jgi:hypothetical protein
MEPEIFDQWTYQQMRPFWGDLIDLSSIVYKYCTLNRDS